MKAVLGHGTGLCAMEKLIQLINYCSCLPQHQSTDPLAPAPRANRKAFLITAGHCILPLHSLSWVHRGEFSLLELVGNPWEPQAWARLWETGKPGSHLGSASCPGCWIRGPAASQACLSLAWILPKPGLDPARCWLFICLGIAERGKGVRMAAGLPHLLVRIIKQGALNESLGITADPHTLFFSKLPDSSPCSLYQCPGIVPSSHAHSQCCCWDSFQKKILKKIAKQMKLCWRNKSVYGTHFSFTRPNIFSRLK